MWAAGSFEATFQKSVWEFLTKIVSSPWGGLGTSNRAGRDDFYDTFFYCPLFAAQWVGFKKGANYFRDYFRLV